MLRYHLHKNRRKRKGPNPVAHVESGCTKFLELHP